MSEKRLKVLLVIEQCNPEWPSVPLVGYNFYSSLANICDAELVTHVRNREALSGKHPDARIKFISESPLVTRYYSLVSRAFAGKKVNWPLLHALGYPVYAEFNAKVHKTYSQAVRSGQYDIVHCLTPILPRYPYRIIEACVATPFVLGPVNGGVPFPSGFGETARKEFSGFNFMRAFARFLPGYMRTYLGADAILAGSDFTMRHIENLTAGRRRGRLVYFPENGLSEDFFRPSRREDSAVENREDGGLSLIFAGRLVPYKGADMVISAMAGLTQAVREKTRLTIAGDGPEKENLVSLSVKTGLEKQVSFTGNIPQKELIRHYAAAEVFCFPSVREFGGAVVIEAMAAGLPCIVVDNGGIAEFVTEDTGFRITPESPEYVVGELVRLITLLVENPGLRKKMAEKAVSRAAEFLWTEKAASLVRLYDDLVVARKRGQSR